jgi:hypothetical protein
LYNDQHQGIPSTSNIIFSCLKVVLLLAVLVEALVEVLKQETSITIWMWDITERKSYRGQGNVGHDNSVQSTRGVTERLALISVGVVLVLVGLATSVFTFPGHGAVGDADVALGGDRGGLLAEVPVGERVLARVYRSRYAIDNQLSA